MTAQLGIQTAIVAALTAALTGVTVRANVAWPLAIAETRYVVVTMLGSEAEGRGQIGGPFDWVTTFRVDCYARATGGAASDPIASLDPLLETVWNALSGVTASGMGAIDVRMRPQIGFAVEEAETATARAALTLQVQHRTETATLNPWA